MLSIEELKKIELLKGIPDEYLDKIKDICEVHEFKENEIIFHEGDDAKRIYTLLDGEVEIFIQSSVRPERIPLSIIKIPYETFGWSALVPPHYYTSGAITRKPTKTASMEREKLMDILEKDPLVGMIVYRKIATVISSRLRNCRAQLLKAIY